jgi:hypothetical protein
MRTPRPHRAAESSAVLALLFGGEARAQPDADRVRQELARVFERREFNPSTDDWAWLRNFFEWLGTLHTEQPALYWVILIGCLVLLALLLGHMVWTVRRAFVFSRRVTNEAETREQRRRLSERFREQAEARAAEGEYTEAVRLLFLSLVHAFDESGRLLFQPALTNREYLRSFAGRPALERELAVFVELLDANWYGQHPTSPGQYEECRALYDAVRRGG